MSADDQRRSRKAVSHVLRRWREADVDGCGMNWVGNGAIDGDLGSFIRFMRQEIEAALAEAREAG